MINEKIDLGAYILLKFRRFAFEATSHLVN